jgi:hypothetical protein
MCNNEQEDFECAMHKEGHPMGEVLLEATGGREQVERGTLQKCSCKGFFREAKTAIGVTNKWQAKAKELSHIKNK